MKLAEEAYASLRNVRWFSELGSQESPALGFPCHLLSSKAEAMEGFSSERWADAKTEGQGDLTGYLAKHRYDIYVSWNEVARQSRELLDKNASGAIAAALATAGLPATWLDAVRLDLNRAVVEIAYRRLVPRAPAFFEQLLRIYEAGRLPCGWTDDLDLWPNGRIMVF